MDIILSELKKIWRPYILIILGVLGLGYYFLFSSFYVDYFYNGSEAKSDFELSYNWSKLYGNTLDLSEIKEINIELENEVEIFNKSLKDNPVALENSIISLESFREYRNEVLQGKVNNINEEIVYSIIDSTNYFKIQQLERFLEFYESLIQTNNLNHYTNMGYSEEIANRIYQLKNNQESWGYLPTSVLESTIEYLKYLAIWVVLSNTLLFSPVLVKDKVNSIRPIQWTSKKGRKIFDTQFKSSLISAITLTSINVIIYVILLLPNKPFSFWNLSLNSIWYGIVSWLDWNYGTYFLVLIFIIYVLSIISAMITFFLSRFSNNYISMLLKAIPLFVLLGPILGSWILDRPFLFKRFFINGHWLFLGAEILVLAIIFLIGILLIALSYKIQNKMELVD